jgi:hypothetical protein
MQVFGSSGSLRVVLHAASPLNVVISSVCAHEKLECTNIDSLRQQTVPPGEIKGSCAEILKTLLEGSGANFQFSRRSDGAITTVVVLGRVSSSQNALVTAPDSIPHDAPPTPEVFALAPIITAETSSSNDPTIQSQLVQKMFAAGYANAEPTQQYLPFPDANGQPVPVDTTPPKFLPFPDSLGNPILVQPAKPGSPFPPGPAK